MIRILNWQLLLLTFLFLTACVSKEKYDAAQTDNRELRTEKDSLRQAFNDRRYLEYDLKRVQAELDTEKEECALMREKFTALEKNYKDLLNRYDEIINQNQSLLSATSEEKTSLVDQLAAKQTELDQKERALKQLEYTLLQKEAALNDLSTAPPPPPPPPAQPDCGPQLAELNAALAAKENALSGLRSRINQALLGFSADDLTVSESNGKIYVTLSQNLLFASGSDRVDWKGKQALSRLAEVLKRNPDIDITVEGHTDSTGSAAANWNLSTRRATTVVNILTGYGVSPKRMTAAGRALYFPVATNATTAGKAKNRRTEIILTPNLDELYRIINQ